MEVAEASKLLENSFRLVNIAFINEFAELCRRLGITAADVIDLPVFRLLRRGQVRWFTKPLHHHAAIQKIALESFDNSVAPTFVAITAELGESQDAITEHATRNTQHVPPHE